MNGASMPAILLTGGTGFVGAALLRALRRRGFPVVLLKRSSSDPSRIADLLDGREGIAVYDVDRVSIETVFARHEIDVLIHLATAYGRGDERLNELIEANVLYPLRLLQAAVENGVKTFLNTDTFSAKAAELPEGLAGYVLTKKQFRQCGELLAGVRGIRFVNVRIEHAYGPMDGIHKFVPTLVRALLANQSSFDLTPGEQVRDFVYVDDVVEAYMTLLVRHSSLPGEAVSVDVGTGCGQTLASMALMARELCGSTTELRFGALPYRKGEQMWSVADTGSLCELGWQAAVSLREGLRRTIEASRP
jgi:nucleoside-diphosphate-sugar epimerase